MTHSYTLAIALCAALLSGCTERAAQQQSAELSKGTPELLLKTYDVPARQVQQIHAVLSNTFAGLGDHMPARVQGSPDGQLLVIGSAGIHRGVEELVAKMAESKPMPPPPTVEIEYWFVTGQPAKETAIGLELQQIAAALEAVASAQGAMRFDKLESARLSTLSDERGETSGKHTSIDQRASVSVGKIIADIKLHTIAGARLETRLSLSPDKLIVLGETGVNMGNFKTNPVPGEGPFTLFYVIRATVHDGI